MEFNNINQFNKSCTIIFNELQNLQFEKKEELDKIIKGLELYVNYGFLSDELLKYKNIISLKISMEFPQLFVGAGNVEDFKKDVISSVVLTIKKLKEENKLKKDLVLESSSTTVLRNEFGSLYLNKIPENPKDFLFIIIQLLDQIGFVKAECFENIQEENCLEILKNLNKCKSLLENGVDINDLLSLKLGLLKQVLTYAGEMESLLSEGISFSDIERLDFQEINFSNINIIRLLCENKSIIEILSKTDTQKKSLIFKNVIAVLILIEEKINLEQMINLDLETLNFVLKNYNDVASFLHWGADISEIQNVISVPDRRKVIFENSIFVQPLLKQFATLENMMKLSDKEFHFLLKNKCHLLAFRNYAEAGISLKQITDLSELITDEQVSGFNRLVEILAGEMKISLKTAFETISKKEKGFLTFFIQNIDIFWKTVMYKDVTFENAEKMLLKIFKQKGNY